MPRAVPVSGDSRRFTDGPSFGDKLKNPSPLKVKVNKTEYAEGQSAFERGESRHPKNTVSWLWGWDDAKRRITK